MRRRHLILFVIIFTGSACNGGGGQADAAGEAPPTAKPATAATVSGRIEAIHGHDVVLRIDGMDVPITEQGTWSHTIALPVPSRSVPIALSVDGVVISERTLSLEQ